jgi:hypothetical protein
MTDTINDTQISFKEFLLHIPDWIRTLPECIDVNDSDNIEWLTQNLAAHVRFTVGGHPCPTVAIPEPVPEPVPVAIPEPVPVAIPEPVPEPVPVAIPEPVPEPVPVAIPEPVLPTKPKTGDRLFPFYIENGKVNQFKSRIFVSDDYKCGVVVLTYFDVVSTKRKDGRIYGNEMEEIWANDKLISSSKQRVKYALNLHDDPNKPFYYIKHFKHFDD